MVFRQEKAGYIDVSVELCLSNTSNTCIALHNLLHHPNYMCFIFLKLSFAVAICCRIFCKIYNLLANTMQKL